MTLRSKQKLAELIASLAWFGGYLMYAFSDNVPKADNLQGWASTLLIAIVISVGVLLIVSAGFNLIAAEVMITREKAKNNEDINKIKIRIKNAFTENEHEKAIYSNANNLIFRCIAVGVAFALVAMALGVNAVLGLHIILCFSCCIGVAVGCIYSIIILEKERKEEENQK